MEYLTGSGQLRPDQIDGTYDGTPANFVAAQGKDAQQGFATDEPYVYAEPAPVLEQAGRLPAHRRHGLPALRGRAVGAHGRRHGAGRLPQEADPGGPAVHRRLLRRPGADQRPRRQDRHGVQQRLGLRRRPGRRRHEAADRPRHRGQRPRRDARQLRRVPRAEDPRHHDPDPDQGRHRPGRRPQGVGPLHQRVPRPDDRPAAKYRRADARTLTSARALRDNPQRPSEEIPQGGRVG